jgi:hypothetical protein
MCWSVCEYVELENRSSKGNCISFMRVAAIILVVLSVLSFISLFTKGNVYTYVHKYDVLFAIQVVVPLLSIVSLAFLAIAGNEERIRSDPNLIKYYNIH